MTIATFSIVSRLAGSAFGCSVSWVAMVILLDAALRLANPTDLGGELGGALWEELVELLDGDARFLAQRADRRGRPGGEVPLAHEAHDLPVAVRQLIDAVLAGDLLGDALVPLCGIGEEAFG